MSAGDRRDQVAFVTASRVQRPDGGYDATPTEGDTVWARVKPVRATETEQAGRLHGATIYLITILADELPAAASVDDTLRWSTRARGPIDLNIREIRESPENVMETEIIAEAGVVL